METPTCSLSSFNFRPTRIQLPSVYGNYGNWLDRSAWLCPWYHRGVWVVGFNTRRVHSLTVYALQAQRGLNGQRSSQGRISNMFIEFDFCFENSHNSKASSSSSSSSSSSWLHSSSFWCRSWYGFCLLRSLRMNWWLRCQAHTWSIPPGATSRPANGTRVKPRHRSMHVESSDW